MKPVLNTWRWQNTNDLHNSMLFVNQAIHVLP